MESLTIQEKQSLIYKTERKLKKLGYDAPEKWKIEKSLKKNDFDMEKALSSYQKFYPLKSAI